MLSEEEVNYRLTTFSMEISGILRKLAADFKTTGLSI